MKKIALLTIFSFLVLISCDDTRKVLHKKYEDFVSQNDSLKEHHSTTRDTHKDIAQSTQDLQATLTDLEEADSLALVQLENQEELLRKQDALLDSLDTIFEKREAFKAKYQNSDIPEEELKKQLTEIRNNSKEIRKSLEQTHNELERIKKDQSTLKSMQSKEQ